MASHGVGPALLFFFPLSASKNVILLSCAGSITRKSTERNELIAEPRRGVYSVYQWLFTSVLTPVVMKSILEASLIDFMQYLMANCLFPR